MLEVGNQVPLVTIKFCWVLSKCGGHCQNQVEFLVVNLMPLLSTSVRRLCSTEVIERVFILNICNKMVTENQIIFENP